MVSPLKVQHSNNEPIAQQSCQSNHKQRLHKDAARIAKMQTQHERARESVRESV